MELRESFGGLQSSAGAPLRDSFGGFRWSGKATHARIDMSRDPTLRGGTLRESGSGPVWNGQTLSVVLSTPATLRHPLDPAPNRMTELFIDLITTSCMHSLRFMMVVTAVSIGEYIIMFFPFWWLTFSTMLFRNRFNCGDAMHQVFLFVHVMLLAFMAVNAAR